MPLRRFLFKYGKVGKIARMAAQAYKELHTKMPNATEAEILNGIYVIYGSARMLEGKLGYARLWHHEVTDAERIEWRNKNPPANLSDTVLRIVQRDPDFPLFPYSAVFQLRAELTDVIDEVLDKEVPGWRDRPAKQRPPAAQRAESCERTLRRPPGNEQTSSTPASPARNPEAVRRLNEAMLLQNPEEAIQQLDFALSCAPDLEEAWYTKGQKLQELGKHEQAIQCYERAPGIFQAWCNRGLALRRLGQNELALQSYDRAIALNNWDKITWLNRGVVQEKLGRLSDAIASYDTALGLDSGYSDAWVNKGDLLRRMKQYDEALKCLDRGLALNPTDSIGWINKGRLFSNQERWKEAVTCFDTVLRYNKRFEDAWMEEGICLGELARFDEAAACFNVVIQLNQKNGYAWYNKGLVILQSYKNYVEAELCFNEALRLGVKEADAYADMCHRKIIEDNID